MPPLTKEHALWGQQLSVLILVDLPPVTLMESLLGIWLLNNDVKPQLYASGIIFFMGNVTSTTRSSPRQLSDKQISSDDRLHDELLNPTAERKRH